MKNHNLKLLFLFLIPPFSLLLTFSTLLLGATPPLFEVKQGEVIFLSLPVSKNQPVLEGRFLGQKIYFDQQADSDRFGALIGVDLDEKPSEQPVVDLPEGETLAVVHILPNQFGRQEVQVAPQYVNPSKRQMDRIMREKKEIHTILLAISEKRYWHGNFIMPVTGTPKGTFGLRRFFNGEARNPHNGEDISAPEKTPVYAPNDGVVVGVVNHFFSGKGIFIDHGQGVFTEYFHLFKAEVKKGQKIKKGDKIGIVGHTGRVTGPHLHWGMVINGARVNPLSVVNLKLE